jgi:Fur family ferric uptake transcriptional regulator
MGTTTAMDKRFARRSTQQRQLVLGIIGRAKGHVDADEIYRRARQKLPSISLSTVYRSLQLFKDLGLVEEHQLDGARRYYESAPRSSHHHMVCLGCNQVFEFTCPSTERMKSKLKREGGFKVTGVDVRLVGYCPKCQQRFLDKADNNEEKERERERR